LDPSAREKTALLHCGYQGPPHELRVWS
jgi:hypothetical protein